MPSCEFSENFVRAENFLPRNCSCGGPLWSCFVLCGGPLGVWCDFLGNYDYCTAAVIFSYTSASVRVEVFTGASRGIFLLIVWFY